VEYMGFTMEKNESGAFETGYISNPRSMLQSTYRPSFWVARKKGHISTTAYQTRD
jgi:carnosine N-methyltransferase